MLPIIENLLVLQECDRKLHHVQTELASVSPRRDDLRSKAGGSQTVLDTAKANAQKIESDRKKLELDAEAKRSLIEKYSLQQFQTKKNEEFRALAHEIEGCKKAIFELENQQIDLMEKAEQAAREVAKAGQIAKELKAVADGQIASLDKAEQELTQKVAALKAERAQLATTIEESALARYERLLKHKGGNVVVGIDHGVCGGCHMKFPHQVVISCQAQDEIVTCPNCGRILFYRSDMSLAVAE